MIRMTVVLFALGCSMKPADDKSAAPGKSAAMAPSGSMGSAMGTTMMDAAAPVIVDAAPVGLATRYAECNRFTVEQRWNELRSCYVPSIAFEAPGLDETRTLDAEIDHHAKTRVAFPVYTQEPQLVLVNGNTVVSILLVAGTTADKKQFGIYLGNVVEADAAGRFTKDLAFFDAKTLEGQLTKKPVRAIAMPFPTKT